MDACGDVADGSGMRFPAHRTEAAGLFCSECPACDAARWMIVQIPVTGSSMTIGVSESPRTSSFSGAPMLGDDGATGMAILGVAPLSSWNDDDLDFPERDDDGARGGSAPLPEALVSALKPPLAAGYARSCRGYVAIGCGGG